MEFVVSAAAERKLSAHALGPHRSSSQRSDRATYPIRVEGKFFTHGSERLRLQGVTYGPFAENDAGAPFPSIRQVDRDFQSMREASLNALRTYHVPPRWMLDLADAQGHCVLMDIPWSKHVCFLDSARAQAEARRALRS